MTNVSGSPRKVELRRRLTDLGERALQKEGWVLARAGLGKSSMRRITRGKEQKLATIRTSQDTWIAFPRNEADTGWSTLELADVVVAVSVDSFEKPEWIQAHIIGADEMRNRFDRAFKARLGAGYQIDRGRGVWISLYEQESEQPVTLVGAGAGLVHEPVLREPLHLDRHSSQSETSEENAPDPDQPRRMTIAEAKEALALTFGVSPSAIRITIEG